MLLIDTNLLSELRRPERAGQRVRAWAAAQDQTEWFLSVMTVLEVEHGALLLARKDERQGAALSRWLHATVLPQFAGRILPATTECALMCASLHVPNPRNERDAWIAATARVHGLAVATRNIRDFAGTGVPVLNPWEV